MDRFFRDGRVRAVLSLAAFIVAVFALTALVVSCDAAVRPW